MTHSRYPGLDGLRGLAALLVTLHHTGLKGTDIGGLSVFLFFALSGFLITGILVRARRELEAGRETLRGALVSFWIQRALRIFPAYYVWLAIFLPFDVLLFSGQTVEHLGWYLLYVQNFLVGFVTQVWQDFTHTWSLAVEQQYYVFFAPLTLVVPSRWHVRFFAGAIVLCLMTAAALEAAGYGAITLYPSPSTGFLLMAAGALLSVATPAQIAPFARPAGIWAALAALALLTLHPIAERAGLLRLPYPILLAASAAALTTVLAATLAAPRSRAVAVLDSAPLRYLGKISYALYIVHLPLAYWAHATDALDGFGHDGLVRDLAEFLVVMPTSLVLAGLSWRYVESPCLRLKARLKARAEPEPAERHARV